MRRSATTGVAYTDEKVGPSFVGGASRSCLARTNSLPVHIGNVNYLFHCDIVVAFRICAALSSTFEERAGLGLQAVAPVLLSPCYRT